MEGYMPIHVIKYEDLLEKPKETLGELLKFLLNAEDLSGTKVEKLITKTVGSYKGLYEVRPSGGKAWNNMEKFSEEQLSQIKKIAGPLMTKFGYMQQF